MRLIKSLSILCICLFLSACVSSLLIGNQVQSKLMWSFLKPLVGFDPNEVKFFEAPIIKDRMTALLGDKYEPTMKLLRTAQEIQQEGALFYVASRYAPPQAQAITDKAAMVWNADTNQMAVMLIKDGTPEILSEQIEGAKEKITPVLPQELQRAYDKAQAAKQVIDEKQKALENVQDIMENPIETVTEKVNQKVDTAVDENVKKVKSNAEENIAPLLPTTEIDEKQRKIDDKQREINEKQLILEDELELDEALKKEAEELKKSP